MTEFEDMNIDKEMRSSSKLRADMHLGMIQIDEVLANITPPASTKSASETGQPAKKSVKLTKLVLQKFSGEPHTWQRFWDVFERNIHKNKALEPIDKFDYLIGLLHGPAATAVQGFEVTGANYEEAIGKLKRRFDRKNLIFQSHMEEFMKIQPVFSFECAFCGRNHLHEECRKVSDLEVRKRLVRKFGRCFRCIRKGHRVRECRATTKCSKCQGDQPPIPM